jgi:hypothetical protein
LPSPPSMRSPSPPSSRRFSTRSSPEGVIDTPHRRQDGPEKQKDDQPRYSPYDDTIHICFWSFEFITCVWGNDILIWMIIVWRNVAKFFISKWNSDLKITEMPGKYQIL